MLFILCYFCLKIISQDFILRFLSQALYFIVFSVLIRILSVLNTHYLRTAFWRENVLTKSTLIRKVCK